MGKPHIKVTKKGILAIGGVVVLLLGMAGAGLFVWWLQNKDRLPTSEGGIITTPATPLLPAVEEAQSLAMSGDTAAANKKIEEALKQPNVAPEDKQKLLVQQGVNYGNDGDYKKALEIYLDAEKSKSDFTVSHLIGEAYEALGNKEKAIEYFKKGLSQLDPNAISYTSDKRYYEAKVKELGGQL
jgi:tetratricopeptide (TPR) repeat protein